MIALIDYGAGNLTSVRKGFSAAGAELYTPKLPIDLAPSVLKTRSWTSVQFIAAVLCATAMCGSTV